MNMVTIILLAYSAKSLEVCSVIHKTGDAELQHRQENGIPLQNKDYQKVLLELNEERSQGLI